MKCYTIREGKDPIKGLFVSTDSDNLNPAVVIGAGDQSTAIPVSQECATKFYERQKYVEHIRALIYGLDDRTKAEACDAGLKEAFNKARQSERYPGQLRAQMEMEWDDNKPIREQFSKDSHHLIHGYIWSTEDPAMMCLMTAELSDRNEKHPLRITRERKDQEEQRIESNKCLVHVDVGALYAGRMWLESTAWDEYLDRDSVERQFKGFPSCGIEVIAIGTGADGEPQALLRMSKKASFRICRNGDFREANKGLVPQSYNERRELVGDHAYAYPVMVIVWPGSSLRVFPPKKFERAA